MNASAPRQSSSATARHRTAPSGSGTGGPASAGAAWRGHELRRLGPRHWLAPRGAERSRRPPPRRDVHVGAGVAADPRGLAGPEVPHPVRVGYPGVLHPPGSLVAVPAGPDQLAADLDDLPGACQRAQRVRVRAAHHHHPARGAAGQPGPARLIRRQAVPRLGRDDHRQAQ